MQTRQMDRREIRSDLGVSAAQLKSSYSKACEGESREKHVLTESEDVKDKHKLHRGRKENWLQSVQTDVKE